MVLCVLQEAPREIVLASNVTNVTLSSVEMNYVFSVAGNTARGSTGLTHWLCMYHYNATPSQPQFISTASLSADSVVIQWTPLTCDSRNKARVLHYIIQSVSNLTGTSQVDMLNTTAFISFS